jgi:hypothetical protein
MGFAAYIPDKRILRKKCSAPHFFLSTIGVPSQHGLIYWLKVFRVDLNLKYGYF